MQQTFHLLISGKVQGVFYRATAKEKAGQLNIKGWIKNTDEGNVEALVSGDEPALKDFIEWCKRGPDKALVKDVSITENHYIAFEKFTILK